MNATAHLRPRLAVSNANPCWCDHPASTADVDARRHVCATEPREVVLSNDRYLESLPVVSASQVLGADAAMVHLERGVDAEPLTMTVLEARRLVEALTATIDEVAAHGRRRRRRSSDT